MQTKTAVTIQVRPYRPQDLDALREIYYQTGLMGESLAGTNLFNDRVLFNMLFFDYYLRYEPQHCFVAVDAETDQPLGYIFGTLDTAAQEKTFTHKMIPRILLRMFFVTWWRHPESFKQTLQIFKNSDVEQQAQLEEIKQKFPAHLHINMSPNVHSRGGGSLLMQRFLQHLRAHHSPGVHLGTSNQNLKAVPFYQKHGFQLAFQAPSHMWDVPKEQIEYLFTKSLDPIEE